MNNLNQSEPNYKEIGIRLREVRGTLSQTAFGETIGYSYSYVKDCEHGKKQSLEYLFKVSDIYSVSLEWLLKGTVPICADTEKAEAISDPDLEDMIDILKTLMKNDDSDLRGWTKVQFKTAFKEYYVAHDEKKL